MPIQHAIWRIDGTPRALAYSRLESELALEEMIVTAPEILSDQWMLIGRQERTAYGGIVDLVAIAPDASLILIELKRDRTPREVVAQAIDYAAWLEELAPEAIARMFERFSNGGDTLETAYEKKFGTPLDEDVLNQSHQIVLVAAELDAASERIIGYLNSRGIAINVLYFQVFSDGEQKLLSRAWLIDPGETQASAASSTKSKAEKVPWNGEYYVSFGDSGPVSTRSWADAMRYGFISGGGGSWYSQTLRLLSPGDRVWVNVPRTGYVGVGIVRERMKEASVFTVLENGNEVPCLDVLKYGDLYRERSSDPDKAEYFVGVEWLDAVHLDRAVKEVGLYGIQHTVCRPQTAKWPHTVERLKLSFPNWNRRVE